MHLKSRIRPPSIQCKLNKVNLTLSVHLIVTLILPVNASRYEGSFSSLCSANSRWTLVGLHGCSAGSRNPTKSWCGKCPILNSAASKPASQALLRCASLLSARGPRAGSKVPKFMLPAHVSVPCAAHCTFARIAVLLRLRQCTMS
jgi:hypothetical protein